MTRDLVFLKPDYIVIFDRVTATDPAFPKSLPLHVFSAPAIDGIAAGPGVKTFVVPPRDTATLLFLLGGGFLFRSFLGCVLHRLILPNIKFCDYENRNVIHI